MRIIFFLTILILSGFYLNQVFAQSQITIIEVETNPAGSDAGNEWIRIFNPSSSSVDISGWKIRTTHGQTNTYTIASGTIIDTCNDLRINFPSQFLDNTDESVILQDRNGNIADQTPTINDSQNTAVTWTGQIPSCTLSIQPSTQPTQPSIPPTQPSIPPTQPAAQPSTDNLLTVIFVDLGTKGESILVLYPNGKVMLIDGGMPQSYTKLESVLKQYDVSEIDVIVGTHPDQDHIAGLSSVLADSDFDVKQVITSHVPSTTQTYQNFVSQISSNGLQQQTVHDGYSRSLDNTVTTRIVSPPQRGILEETNASLENSNSLITHLEYGQVSFLFTGDATHTTEDWIVNNHPSLDVDIINSPHHGSRYSSTGVFLDSITPRLIIISADQNNQYGHPHQDALDRYSARSVSYYQTGLEGEIVIKTDGTRCSLYVGNQPEQPCYQGIQAIPEFPFAILVMTLGIVSIVVLSKTRYLKL